MAPALRSSNRLWPLDSSGEILEIEAQGFIGRSGRRDMNAGMEGDVKLVATYRFHCTSRFAVKTVLRASSSSGLL